MDYSRGRTGSAFTPCPYWEGLVVYVRVPSDPVNPTFDDTFRVPVWRWYLYAKEKRSHWLERRGVAKTKTRGRHRA